MRSDELRAALAEAAGRYKGMADALLVSGHISPYSHEQSMAFVSKWDALLGCDDVATGVSDHSELDNQANPDEQAPQVTPCLRCQALAREVERLKAEAARNIVRYTVRGFNAGENADVKAWRQRAEALEARLQKTEEALREISAIGDTLDDTAEAANEMMRTAEAALSSLSPAGREQDGQTGASR